MAPSRCSARISALTAMADRCGMSSIGKWAIRGCPGPWSNSMRLESIATVIRSKNAGPCLLTFDLMLPDQATFAYVTERAASLRRQVARRYGRSENEIAVLPFEPALAVKITLPRDVVSGDVGDRDVYGAQQHAPLLDIEL